MLLCFSLSCRSWKYRYHFGPSYHGNGQQSQSGGHPTATRPRERCYVGECQDTRQGSECPSRSCRSHSNHNRASSFYLHFQAAKIHSHNGLGCRLLLTPIGQYLFSSAQFPSSGPTRLQQFDQPEINFIHGMRWDCNVCCGVILRLLK